PDHVSPSGIPPPHPDGYAAISLACPRCDPEEHRRGGGSARRRHGGVPTPPTERKVVNPQHPPTPAAPRSSGPVGVAACGSRYAVTSAPPSLPEPGNYPGLQVP